MLLLSLAVSLNNVITLHYIASESTVSVKGVFTGNFGIGTSRQGGSSRTKCSPSAIFLVAFTPPLGTLK